MLTVSKATGKEILPSLSARFNIILANKNVDAALLECDKQKGSVGT
jgi:biopolymer transport protein ExbB